MGALSFSYAVANRTILDQRSGLGQTRELIVLQNINRIQKDSYPTESYQTLLLSYSLLVNANIVARCPADRAG